MSKHLSEPAQEPEQKLPEQRPPFSAKVLLWLVLLIVVTNILLFAKIVLESSQNQPGKANAPAETQTPAK